MDGMENVKESLFKVLDCNALSRMMILEEEEMYIAWLRGKREMMSSLGVYSSEEEVIEIER